MNDTAALKALLERVKSAEGPDRALDVRIEHDVIGCWPDFPEKDWASDEEILDQLSACESYEVWFCPPYTASLDASLALLERVLPGWMNWLIRSDESAPFFARIESPDFEAVTWEAGDRVKTDVLSGSDHHARAKSPALALLAALLTALISESPHD